MYIPILCIFISALTASRPTRAYVVDDTDGTIQYSGQVAWVPLPNGSSVFNPAKLMNSSVTYGWCMTSHECHIQFPFTGSGVAVYNVLHGPVNASFSVDGGSTASFVHDNSCVSNCCYNVSVYSVQSLANDYHMLDIMLLDYNGEDSEFAFDYAVVDGVGAMNSHALITSTVTSPLVSTQMSSYIPATATSSVTKKGKAPRPSAIIAGILGALTGLVAILVMALYFWRRNRPPTKKRRHRYNTTAASRLPRALSPPPEKERTNGAPLFPYTSADTQLPRKEAIAVPRRATSPHVSEKTQPMNGNLRTNAGDAEPRKPHIVPEAETATHSSPEGYAETEDRGLSALQIRLIAQCLLRENIPNSVVATLVDSMIQSSGGDDESAGATLRDSQVEPPGYDSL